MTEHDEVRLRCDRALSGHRRRTVRQTLAALAESPLADLPPDSYGEGEAIAGLEREVAGLLGKPAALFAVKGVAAQQAALRAWSDRSGRRNVALHPKSHIDGDERAAFERLHNLAGVRLGTDHAPFDADDLARVAEPLGVVTIELPLRRAGYRLPEWDALVAMSQWCRAHGVPLHLDGARLWEAQPYYDRPLAAIAALADSVYVSCYKGLGGLGGALLAGPEDFIAEARVWHARHCGPLYTAFPFVLGASDGLRRHLPRMGEYYRRAQALATTLATLPGVTPTPAPPQCNAFRLCLPGRPDALKAAHLQLARETGVWLFGGFSDTLLPGLATAEVSIGDAADDLADDEIARLVARLVDAARDA